MVNYISVIKIESYKFVAAIGEPKHGSHQREGRQETARPQQDEVIETLDMEHPL